MNKFYTFGGIVALLLVSAGLLLLHHIGLFRPSEFSASATLLAGALMLLSAGLSIGLLFNQFAMRDRIAALEKHIRQPDDASS